MSDSDSEYDSSDSGSSDSGSESDFDSIFAKVFKKFKAICSWPGCDDDIDCEIHTQFNARIKLFKGVKEDTNKDTRSLLVHPVIEETVQKIFDMEPDNIIFVGLFSQYVIITYFKTVNANARKKSISQKMPGVKVTALGQKAVKLLTKDIIWDHFKERDIAYPTESTPPPNFVNWFKEGTWRHTHVVQRVIDGILVSMNGSSTKRDHAFEHIKALRKLLQAFETTDGSCGCGRSGCDVKPTLNGIMGVSPDRENDNLGYGDVEQIIKLVCKWHNTSFKHDTTPKKRAYSESWLAVTTANIRSNYKVRMNTLKKKKCKSVVEKEQLRKFAHFEAMESLKKKKTKGAEDTRLIKTYMADDDYHSIANIKRILIELRRTTKHCWKCLRDLIYGDDADIDIMTLANVATRASPDRIDNMLGYTGGNTKLVCTSCNFPERDYDRRIIDAVRSTKTPDYPLTPDLKQLCIIYLNALIEIEDTDDSKKVKIAKKRAMCKRLFPKPEKVGNGDEDEGYESDDE